jgi:hypothetical protein
MAFNPFTSFRKYQKFWMASLILLSMVTFVLCSGLGQGGIEDRILNWIGRSRGAEVARIGGRTYYRDDLSRLKEQRNIANEYMHKAVEAALKKLEVARKNVAKISNQKEREQKLRLATTLYRDLTEVQARPRYFSGGDKFDDLIDFILWQQQADNLGVRLQPPLVMSEVYRAVHAHEAGLSAYEMQGVLNSVRWNHQNISESDVVEALNQEYRVRIAQVALVGARPGLLMAPGAIHLARKMDVRLALTPEQMWEFYRQNRTPLDIAVVPVAAADFLAKVPAPDKLQLEALFEQYKGVKFDPASPVPGFIAPEEVKVTWVTADPQSDYYKNLARVATTLEQAPPVAWSPALPGLGEALDYAGRATAWKASLERNYENIRKGPNRDLFRDESLTSPYSALALYTRLYAEKPKPEVAAAVVGSGTQPGLFCAAPAIFQAAAYQDRAEELAPVVRAEVKRRWPVGVTLFLSGFNPTPLQTAALWTAAEREVQYLPFGTVERELREAVEHSLARAWAGQVMHAVKDALEKHRNNGEGLEVRLGELMEQYPGLQVYRTAQYRTPFDVAQAPELAGLQKSFERYRTQINTIEGRAGTERMLKEDDFPKLFFGSEPFSVGNTGKYDPRAWPPVVTVSQKQAQLAPDAQPGEAKTIDLWETAESPILFWKTEAQPDRTPKSLADVRGDVERAWKLAKARSDLALPRARAAAQALAKVPAGGTALLAEMERQAALNGEHLIQLNGVTPLVETRLGENAPPEWQPYKLPKDLFSYPTEEMAKNLLSLRNRTAPVQIKEEKGDSKKDVVSVVTELNKLNKALFDAHKKARQAGAPLVQVLTNRPRSVFYVAAVIQEHPASAFDFREVWRRSLALQRTFLGETPIDRAQNQIGQEFLDGYVRQLRRQADLPENLSSADLNQARKDFEGTGGT